MSLLSRLFGYEGKVRFQGATACGKPFTGTIKIESVGYDKGELEERLKDILFVEFGKRIQEVKIIAMT